jgi:hypothetical protein
MDHLNKFNSTHNSLHKDNSLPNKDPNNSNKDHLNNLTHNSLSKGRIHPNLLHSNHNSSHNSHNNHNHNHPMKCLLQKTSTWSS